MNLPSTVDTNQHLSSQVRQEDKQRFHHVWAAHIQNVAAKEMKHDIKMQPRRPK